jgi:replicative DNA helicase
MKRQVVSVLVDTDEIIYSTCFAERHPEQRTDKRPISDLRESGCLTANTRILRADTGAQVTFGELIRTGERPLVWSLDEGAHGRAADDQCVLQRTQGSVQAAVTGEPETSRVQLVRPDAAPTRNAIHTAARRLGVRKRHTASP